MRQTVRVILSAILLFTAAALFAADDTSAVTRYSQGINLFFGGQYTGALEQFRAAAKLSPDNPAYHYFIGLCQARLGNLDAALSSYTTGAAAELTPAGIGIDVPSHLMRIQGEERLQIERVRQAVRAEFNARAAKRRAILYGENINQGRRALTTSKRQDSADSASSDTDSAADSSIDALPMVAPIMPLSGKEMTAAESEDLIATRVFGGYIYLSEEMGKPMLSTVTKRRLARKQAREMAEEASGLDAHGNPFVDIYSDSQVKSDGEVFSDPDEPAAVEPDNTEPNNNETDNTEADNPKADDAAADN